MHSSTPAKKVQNRIFVFMGKSDVQSLPQEPPGPDEVQTQLYSNSLKAHLVRNAKSNPSSSAFASRLLNQLAALIVLNYIWTPCSVAPQN